MYLSYELPSESLHISVEKLCAKVKMNKGYHVNQSSVNNTYH